MRHATQHRIALIHALDESVSPARTAFARNWPEAFCFDLLDNSLAIDRAEQDELDATIMVRFQALGDYAAQSSGKGGRTRGILFTCSAFGPAIDAVKKRLPIPVLRPNEAAFARALEIGGTIGLVVTFPHSLPMLQAELEAMAAERRQRIVVRPILVSGALSALKAGDGATHDELVARACQDVGPTDALVLGQFSLARAAPSLRQFLSTPVLTTPDCAVEALRARLGESAVSGSG
jgi:Asp/Glu/hydantoin racemase